MGDQAAAVFDALGDPSRRRIVELLREGPSPVGVLAGRLPIGRPAVSKHLKVLSDAGLTEHRAIGTSNVYALRGDGIEMARRWLTESWDAVLASYAAAARDHAQRRDQPARINQGDAT
jgi:DNA-binding transcriptional ArsR family regulator